jgi:hypothetical protein
MASPYDWNVARRHTNPTRENVSLAEKYFKA